MPFWIRKGSKAALEGAKGSIKGAPGETTEESSKGAPGETTERAVREQRGSKREQEGARGSSWRAGAGAQYARAWNCPLRLGLQLPSSSSNSQLRSKFYYFPQNPLAVQGRDQNDDVTCMPVRVAEGRSQRRLPACQTFSAGESVLQEETIANHSSALPTCKRWWHMIPFSLGAGVAAARRRDNHA